MTTRELMEVLAKCDPDEEIAFSMTAGCCGEFETLELEDTDIFDYASTAETRAGKTRNTLRVNFNAVPGYYSCIQVGKTIKDHNEYWTTFNKSEYLRK